MRNEINTSANYVTLRTNYEPSDDKSRVLSYDSTASKIVGLWDPVVAEVYQSAEAMPAAQWIISVMPNLGITLQNVQTGNLLTRIYLAEYTKTDAHNLVVTSVKPSGGDYPEATWFLRPVADPTSKTALPRVMRMPPPIKSLRSRGYKSIPLASASSCTLAIVFAIVDSILFAINCAGMGETVNMN